MKSNNKCKAQSAFKKLGAVALITATLAMCFTACNQTGGGGGKPTPKPKHAITFSVDSTTPNGTLKAKADGVDETSTSPINVEEGKTVTFTATANAGYRVKGWMLDGSAVNGSNNSYSFTVSKAVSVKVSFEDASTPKPKHAINFSVDSTTPNGTLKAEGDGITQPATSPITVEEGKTVTFTATANDGYRVKGWTLDGKPIAEAGTNTEYKLKVSKPATVSVSFEAMPLKYTVTLNQTEHGKVTASPEIPEDKKMPKDTEITFTAQADAGYKIGKWTVTPAEALQANTGADGSPTAKVKITADTTVSVSFESNGITPNPPTQQGTAILTLDPNKLTIKVKAKTADGSAITVEGCNETTLASDTETTLTAKGTKVILKGKITKLNCIHSQLTSLNVQGLTALQELDCNNNDQLATLGVQGLTALQVLDCSGNQLKTLNVQGLTALQKLNCSANKLPELNVQGCTSLQVLRCYDNKLSELNVQGLTALQKLDCSYNKLTELNVQGCTSLKGLDCYGNKLNAKAMTEILNALPDRTDDGGDAYLYTEEEFAKEGNHKDYTQPAELKDAFDGAKKRKWTLLKLNASGNNVYL